VLGSTISKTGRDHHFTSDNLDGGAEDAVTAAHVGPGSYNNHVVNTIANADKTKTDKQSRSAASATPGKDALGFGAKYQQRELPHESKPNKGPAVGEPTPGPGSYDPRVTEHGGGLTADASTKECFNTGAKAGKAQFGTTSASRGTDIVTDKNNVTAASGWQTPGMGDMNLYDPNVNRELNYDAKKTFHTAAKAGKSGFGGTEKRNVLLSNTPTKVPTQGWTGPIEDTPGPAAYDIKVTEVGKEFDMSVRDGAETMKSSSFASTMQRPGIVLKNAAVPGPGAYTPDFNSTDPVLGSTVSKTGRDHHFTSDNLDGGAEDAVTAAHVGPGSYNNHYHNTILQGQDKAKMELLSASIMSDTFRTIYTGQGE